MVSLGPPWCAQLCSASCLTWTSRAVVVEFSGGMLCAYFTKANPSDDTSIYQVREHVSRNFSWFRSPDRTLIMDDYLKGHLSQD